MVYKFLWNAGRWTADFTVGLGKAVFSHKEIKTLPTKPEHLARLPPAPTWFAEVIRNGGWKHHWKYYVSLRWAVYGFSLLYVVHHYVLPKKARDVYLQQISDEKSHKSHVHHFRGKYQRDEDHHYWEHHHPRKAGEVDEALLKNSKHSDEYLNHGPIAIKH